MFHVPTFVVGPVFGWLRDRHQARRRVRLTTHRAYMIPTPGPPASLATTQTVAVLASHENLYITVTNASPQRAIVVTHVWVDTAPAVQVIDTALPRRLEYGDVWETSSQSSAFRPTRRTSSGSRVVRSRRTTRS